MENKQVVVSFSIDKTIFDEFCKGLEKYGKVTINQALVELVIFQNQTIKSLEETSKILIASLKKVEA